MNNVSDEGSTMDQPVAIDLSRKKRRKRIIFVKTTRTPSKNSNPALAETSVDSRVESTTPSAPTASTPKPKYGPSSSSSSSSFNPRDSPKHQILVATKMPKYSAEKKFGRKSLSPMRSPTKGIVDNQSGKVLERRILGSADDYVDMFQEENPGVPIGYDVSRIASTNQPADASTGKASAPPPASNSSKDNDSAIAVDSDETVARAAAKTALSSTGDARQIQEMVAAEIVAANRSADPYRYRLESSVLRAAQRARIAEARSREKSEEVEDEADMLVCDRVVEQREQHALDNWKKMQMTWSNAKKYLAKKLKKHPDDLVLSRAEEFREKREEYDLIDNATPLHLKHGSEYWMMSLRGIGTRYVPVGNIFSGLFCPVHEDKISEPLVIRAPGVRVPLSQRTDKPKNWRDAKTLVAKKRTLRKQIENLRPHVVTTEESNALMVGGVDLFDWAEQSSLAYYRRMDQGNNNVEFAENLKREADNVSEEVAEPVVEGGLGGAAFVGPRMDVSIEGQPPRDIVNNIPMRLLLESKVGEETLKSVNLKNTGSTALFVVFTKQTEAEQEKTALLSNLRGNGKSKCRVHCHKQTTVVLPGHHIQIPFSFSSTIPGVFSETWTMALTPKPAETEELSIIVRAVSIEEDTGSIRRAKLEDRIAAKVAERAVRETLSNVLDNVDTEKKPETLEEIQLAESKHFLNSNKQSLLPLYYSPTIYSQLKTIVLTCSGESALPSNWNCSLSNIAASIDSLEDKEQKKVLKNEIQTLEKIAYTPVPSSNSSPSWNAAYDLLMSVALSIPDLSDSLRTEKGLEVAPIWKRPRNLRDGKREMVPDERKLSQMCKAWGNRFNVTEGSEEPEPALTPEEQYREALCSSLSVKLLEGIDSFVDSTLLAATSMRDSSRKERNMLLSTKYKLWSALLDEDEDEVNAASSSETEETNDSGGEGGETSKEPTNDIAAAAVSRFLGNIVNSRVVVRLDISDLVFDVDNGVAVLSDESVATELQLQRATECVLQLLNAGAGAITLVGTNNSGESFKPFANALVETLDRPVHFVAEDEDAIALVEQFEEKRRVKEELKMVKLRKSEEKKAAAEARRAARLEAGGDDEDEEDEDEEDEDEEDEDEEDEEGTCPVILLENRAKYPCEKLAYRYNLHALAEEEDIDERNQEMDAYSSILENLCDVLINDDIVGSSTDDVTIGSMKTKKNLFAAGPRLQLELSVLENMVQNTPRPAFGIVGGSDLKDKIGVLNLLIDVLDEIMLGAALSPMFERVKRERYFAEHPQAYESVTTETSTKETVLEAGVSQVMVDVTKEGGETDVAIDTAPEPVVLTPEEDALLPAVRYLVSKAIGNGVILHSCVDYMIGDIAPVKVRSNNFEEEYSGDVQEFAVKPLPTEPTDNSEENADSEEKGEVNGEAGEEDEDEEDMEEEEGEEGETFSPDDPRFIRELYGMPPSVSHTLDIGPLTQENWAKELLRAKSVLWLDPVGSVAHQDFAAGSQALLDALLPDDEETRDAVEKEGETPPPPTDDTSFTAPKRLVMLFGESLVGSLRAGGMADEDITLVSSGNTQTIVEILSETNPGIQKLNEIEITPTIIEEVELVKNEGE